MLRRRKGGKARIALDNVRVVAGKPEIGAVFLIKLRHASAVHPEVEGYAVGLLEIDGAFHALTRCHGHYSLPFSIRGFTSPRGR